MLFRPLQSTQPDGMLAEDPDQRTITPAGTTPVVVSILPEPRIEVPLIVLIFVPETKVS